MTVKLDQSAVHLLKCLRRERALCTTAACIAQRSIVVRFVVVLLVVVAYLVVEKEN